MVMNERRRRASPSSSSSSSVVSVLLLLLAAPALPVAPAAAQQSDTTADRAGFPSDTAQRLQDQRQGFAAGPSSFPSREELKARADSLRAAAEAAESQERRKELKDARSRVERRLEAGDFSQGDIVRLAVEGEPRWTGRFTVGSGSRLKLPDVEPISLEGTLYSEADERLREVLSRYIRRPEIRVQPLTRVAVQGAVENPGFYNIPPSTTLSALVMRAGGPLQSAKLEELTVRREGQRVARGENLAYEGRALEELGVRSGDAVHVPEEGGGVSVRNVGFALGSVASFVSMMLTVF